jgi:hypothetical protein
MLGICLLSVYYCWADDLGAVFSFNFFHTMCTPGAAFGSVAFRLEKRGFPFFIYYFIVLCCFIVRVSVLFIVL